MHTAASRPRSAHGARFLALDVALQPGGVHGLDEELLAGIDDHALTALLQGDRWTGRPNPDDRG